MTDLASTVAKYAANRVKPKRDQGGKFSSTGVGGGAKPKPKTGSKKSPSAGVSPEEIARLRALSVSKRKAYVEARKGGKSHQQAMEAIGAGRPKELTVNGKSATLKPTASGKWVLEMEGKEPKEFDNEQAATRGAMAILTRGGSETTKTRVAEREKAEADKEREKAAKKAATKRRKKKSDDGLYADQGVKQ